MRLALTVDADFPFPGPVRADPGTAFARGADLRLALAPVADLRLAFARVADLRLAFAVTPDVRLDLALDADFREACDRGLGRPLERSFTLCALDRWLLVVDWLPDRLDRVFVSDLEDRPDPRAAFFTEVTTSRLTDLAGLSSRSPMNEA